METKGGPRWGPPIEAFGRGREPPLQLRGSACAMVSTKYSELIASGPVGIEASKIHIILMVNINMTGEYIVVNNGESWLIMGKLT